MGAALNFRLPPARRARLAFRAKPAFALAQVGPSFTVTVLARHMIDALASVVADIALDIAGRIQSLRKGERAVLPDLSLICLGGRSYESDGRP
jgi:hypothetical protein